MKTHSTNYFDIFIEVAEDTKVLSGTKPPLRDKKTVAQKQYELLEENPYKFTSDEVLFQIFADRNGLTKSEFPQTQQAFFSKGQPCFRASPLAKTYGFGVHSNSEGKIALVGMETEEYQNFLKNPDIKKVKAMRSGR